MHHVPSVRSGIAATVKCPSYGGQTGADPYAREFHLTICQFSRLKASAFSRQVTLGCWHSLDDHKVV